MKTMTTTALKIYFIASIMIALVSQTAIAQGSWSVMRKGLYDGDLVSVFFTSADRGWVGGDGGYVAFTTDAGANWTKQALTTTDNVNEIYFRNDDNGYILAGHKVFITNDRGKSWRETRVISISDLKGTSPEFLSIRFSDKKRGWIVGSMSNAKDEVVSSLVLQTQDSGESWTRVDVGFKGELYHLDFVDDTIGWMVGSEGLIMRTIDGGRSWERQTSGVDLNLYNVDFRDSSTGIVVGSKGTILKTDNGGLSWQKVKTSVTGSLLRVNFINDKTGWIVGSGGVILKTEDKGRSWSKSASPTPDALYGLYTDKKGGWAVGKKGLILKYNK